MLWHIKICYEKYYRIIKWVNNIIGKKYVIKIAYLEFLLKMIGIKSMAAL